MRSARKGASTRTLRHGVLQTLVSSILALGGARAIADTSLVDAPAETIDARPVASAVLGDALAGLTAAEQARFADGKAEFMGIQTVASGLGPVFNDVSCAACHGVPSVGGSGTRLETRFGAVTGVVFHPYSDFLLHDMGPLGDGIAQGAATGAEMRTAPLWGVSVQKSLLHDGRVSTLRDAILAHDGQGRPSRDRFAALPAPKQQQLLAFLGTL